MRTRFARPQPKEPEKPVFVRTIEYHGCNIGRTADGETYAIFENGNVSHVRDRSQAMQVIDARDRFLNHGEEDEEKLNVEPTTSRVGRRNRHAPAPEKVKEAKESPRGGYQTNPPEDCPFRVTFDGFPTFYVDNLHCAFSCKDEECPTYIELREGAKLRIRRLDYTTPERHCPHCQSEVSVRGDDQWTYGCGSIADKYSKTVIRNCGKPKITGRRRR